GVVRLAALAQAPDAQLAEAPAHDLRGASGAPAGARHGRRLRATEGGSLRLGLNCPPAWLIAARLASPRSALSHYSPPSPSRRAAGRATRKGRRSARACRLRSAACATRSSSPAS